MKIYLDTCCYNRQFDDQTQGIIKLETQAINSILRGITDGDTSLVWSEALDDEIRKKENEKQKQEIADWKAAADEIIFTTQDIKQAAADLMTHNIKAFDALHVASAAAANCDYFISTDKRLLKRAKSLGLPAVNPLELAEILEGKQNGTGTK